MNPITDFRRLLFQLNTEKTLKLEQDHWYENQRAMMTDLCFSIYILLYYTIL
jgi:hypothetical protein